MTARPVAQTVGQTIDVVEAALAGALEAATTAGRWDAVGQIAKELEARRLARAGNVVAMVSRRTERR